MRKQYGPLHSDTPLPFETMKAKSRAKENTPILNRCLHFINQYLDNNAQAHPTRQKQFLSSGVTWSTIYIEYLRYNESLKDGKPSLSNSYFFSLRKRFFPTVEIRKYCPFSKCSACENFKAMLSRRSNQEKKTQIKKYFDKHLLQMRQVLNATLIVLGQNASIIMMR
jgi:hypothetical protein